MNEADQHITALPPDVRKGSAFPAKVSHLSHAPQRGYAALRCVEKSNWWPSGKPEAFRTSKEAA